MPVAVPHVNPSCRSPWQRGLPWLLSLVLLAGAAWLAEGWAHRHLRADPGASLLELARPGDQLTQEQERHLVAPPYQMVRLIELLTDPANPLQLRPEEKAAVRLHLGRLSGRLDHLLWLQERIAQEVHPRDIRVHLDFMRSRDAHRQLSEPWNALNLEVARVYPGGWPRAALEPPAGWSPDPASPAHAAWKAALGDPTADIPGDPFLERRTIHLVTVRMNQHQGGPDASTDRMLQALYSAAELPRQCWTDWEMLFRIAASVDPKATEPDVFNQGMGFDGFSARVRAAAARS